MDQFRAEAENVGQCLHLNHMTSSDTLLVPRGVNSRSDYGWTKLGDGPNCERAPHALSLVRQALPCLWLESSAYLLSSTPADTAAAAHTAYGPAVLTCARYLARNSV